MDFYKKGTSLRGRIETVAEALKGQMRALTGFINPKRGPVALTASNNIRFDDMTDYLDDVCENIGLSLDKTKQKTADLAPMVGKRSLNIDITNQDVITRDDDSRKPQRYFNPKPDNSEVPATHPEALHPQAQRKAQRAGPAPSRHYQGPRKPRRLLREGRRGTCSLTSRLTSPSNTRTCTRSAACRWLKSSSASKWLQCIRARSRTRTTAGSTVYLS